MPFSMTYEPDLSRLHKANDVLATVLSGQRGTGAILEAASALVPVTAGFVAVNLPGSAPVWMADSYEEGEAKAAVQRYIGGTYLLNPIWNAIQAGLPSGIHCMADLAPDNWGQWRDDKSVLPADDEEIGFRTPGWPEGLSEISLLTSLPQGAMGEICLARPITDGGFSNAMLDILRAFLPLFNQAQTTVWTQREQAAIFERRSRRLEDFGRDRLSPREAEILQMVLKGHSSLSISLNLGITVTTVKTHRQNGYAKLGIATQQELFHSFLVWAEYE